MKLIFTNGYWYPLETRGFSFLSCTERLSYISYSVYASPFDMYNWICIGASVCVGSSFLTLMFFLKGIDENGILLLYSFLLEHGYHLGRRLQQTRAFNIFISIFLLMAIVLTNGYKGVVITDLTAPASEFRITTFKEAMEQNYTILSEVLPEPLLMLKQMDVANHLNDEGTENIVKEIYFSMAVSVIGDTFFRENIDDVLKKGIFNSSFSKVELYKTISTRTSPGKESVLNILENGTRAEFLKCNKTIFVDSAYKLKPLYLKLRSELDPKRYSMCMANDEISEYRVGWHIQNMDWDKGLITGRMNKIFSSGIYKRWQDLRLIKYLTSTENTEKQKDFSKHPMKLALSTNILTIFIIYLVLIMLDLFVFLCENYRRVFKIFDLLWQNLMWVTNRCYVNTICESMASVFT